MLIIKKYSLFIFIIHFLPFKKCYLLSVIITVYNTGRYLDDSINSLINQTISFKGIQIILVNDGSTDDSEEKCLKYQKQYQKNIIYIKIAHGGVSKARNVGLNYATGKFINFLDSDDKWNYQAFKYIFLFFKFYKKIDLVAGRIKFFEDDQNYHPLDYKFDKTRIVNLNQDYNCIQLSASSVVFRKSSIEGKYFEEKVSYCEDSRFVNNILLFKPKIGLVKEAVYYYRRRSDFSSAIQNQKKDLNFYFGTLNFVSNYIINCSIALYNKILPFVQFLISYDILFRIYLNSNKFMDYNNFHKYSFMIAELLNKIDDKYIWEQKILSNKYKLLTLSKKYGRDLRYDIEIKNNLLIYSKNILINLKTNKHLIVWTIININNNKLYLEAIDNLWLPREKYYYSLKFGNKTFFAKYIENSNFDFITMYGLTQKGRIINFEIPLGITTTPTIFYFYLTYKDITTEILTSSGWFSHIPPILNGYYISGNYIIKYVGNRLTIFPYNKKTEIKFEKLYCYELQKRRKEYIVKLRKHIKNRYQIYHYRKYEIWILNDRRDSAGDNGEYFFRYLKSKKIEHIKVYFAIERNCSDFKRLRHLGNILDLNSKKYLKKFLESNKIISSVSYDWVDNPFQTDRIYIKDLFHFEIIFLSNGIIKDNLSKYLNRFRKNYSLFITSTKMEFKYLLIYHYGYKKSNIILTGMPKYDNLYRLKYTVNKKKILIMPTWRNYIKGTRDLINYKSIYSDRFVFSKFFEFYNSLINNEKLFLVMQKYNYTGILCLHPIFKSQWIDFNQTKIFSVLETCDYPNILSDVSLLITDYSSIFFDFGYLRKPIIYTQFDYEEYRNNHYETGYFDYKKDGFGPICKDLQCTIKEIIFEIENNCILGKKYLKRINNYFIFDDENNSDRIFEEIIKPKNLIIENNDNHIYFYLAFTLFLIIYKLFYFFKPCFF